MSEEWDSIVVLVLAVFALFVVGLSMAQTERENERLRAEIAEAKQRIEQLRREI